jgi:hypothetical protein
VFGPIIDDGADRSGQTVLDWLGGCPEPPPNACFVLTSRPGPHRDMLRRRCDVKFIELDAHGFPEDACGPHRRKGRGALPPP